MFVTDIEIASITQDVWRAFVGLEVDGPMPPDDAFRRSADVGASIEIDGPFRGRVVLGCSPALASEAAALVFEVEPERVDGRDGRRGARRTGQSDRRQSQVAFASRMSSFSAEEEVAGVW
jgi:hypothetical protein